MEMPRDEEVNRSAKKLSDEGAASRAITEMVVLHRMVFLECSAVNNHLENSSLTPNFLSTAVKVSRNVEKVQANLATSQSG